MRFMRLTPLLRKLQVLRKSRLKKLMVCVKTPLKKFHHLCTASDSEFICRKSRNNSEIGIFLDAPQILFYNKNIISRRWRHW